MKNIMKLASIALVLLFTLFGLTNKALFVKPNNVNKRTKAIEASFIIFFIMSSFSLVIIFRGYYELVIFVTTFLILIKLIQL